ncbi:Uncharacterized protein ESCO_002138 [Escovopsis weberi]|uniref:Chromosome transmission fidelity protein 4 n=1 Tax=Escovopsis weberi TaxID=150374 RepID=A0A0N0RTZ9_ESCWE|nr:Uncharacterized protein ESCO_002138 [Escovopsis weberi]
MPPTSQRSISRFKTPGWPASSRPLSSFSPAKAQVQPSTFPLLETRPIPPPPPPPPPPSRAPPALYPNARDLTLPPRRLSPTYFETPKALWMSNSGDHRPPDLNKANLGKTLRILQERLPTLLQTPLPQSILAPNISLQLFPSTHPHLPTVSGRVAYKAALWTSPIAWNRVPLIGNVKLEILAERMTSEPLTFLPRRAGAIPEQLVVRWREERKDREEEKQPQQHLSKGLSLLLRRPKRADPGKAFTGLFIFDFDQEGRILAHTIEQVQEGGNWDKGMGAKFVGLTDWLLGGIKNPGETPMPAFERKHFE